jgi:hypothetical protein
MNVLQQSGSRAYARPSVHDRGGLEQVTKDTDGPGRPEGSISTLIWADPFCPSDDPLPIGSKEAK